MRNGLWIFAAVLVTAGWASGYFVWQPESVDGFGSYVDLASPAETLAVGMPLAAVSGFLLGRRGLLRALGFAAIGLTCVVLAYEGFFAFFGGICLDPGDVCITTWPSRLGELGAELACLGVGWAVQRWTGTERTQATQRRFAEAPEAPLPP